MKKLFTFLTVLFISTSLFAELKFFNPRFFEFYMKGPVNFSNNAIFVDDIMKENAVIDLEKMANDLPKSGFASYLIFDPQVGINFRIKNLGFGINAGVQNYEKITIAKGLFDFLGKGNELNEELDFAMGLNADINFNLGTEILMPIKKKYLIKIKPSLFVPLLHVTTQDSKFALSNTEDGAFIVNMLADAKIYSFIGSLDFKNDFKFPKEGYGFDIGGEISFPINEQFYFSGSFRTPIIPGHLKHVSSATVTYNLEKKLTDFFSGNFDIGLKPDMATGAFEDANYVINRPLKVNAFLDITPMGNFFHLLNGLGFGIRNPFTGNHEAVFYMEYELGIRLKVDNILAFTFATEYTDEIFKHSFAFMLNARFFEIDAEVGFAGPNITSSFRGAGAEASVEAKFGF